MNARAVTITTSDELRLEGRSLAPEGAAIGVALCHPHPLYGGSMSSIIVPTLQRALAHRGVASVRFNFRGVGRSEGRFDRGIGEERDVAAALEHLASETGLSRLSVVGWSFGSMVGLRAATADARVESYVAIAPPVSTATLEYAGPPPERLESWTARVLGICGTDDPICRPSDLLAWLGTMDDGPRVESRVVDGADHYFAGAREELSAIVTEFVVR